MGLVVRSLGLALLILASPPAFARAPTGLCAAQLAGLGARPVGTDFLPEMWEVPIGTFLPFLAGIAGVTDLSPASIRSGPAVPGGPGKTADPAYPVAATCAGHLLFFSKNEGRYLAAVDLRERRKLAGVGGLFGGPAQAWRVTDRIYAVNLYGGDVAFESLIIDVVTGDILFYEGPARFGDLKVVLVVPDRGVLLENYTWGAPSAWGSVGLSLFDVVGSAGRRQLADLPSCSATLPPNAYRWRWALEDRGIVQHTVLHTKSPEPEQALRPLSPTMTPMVPTTAGRAGQHSASVAAKAKPKLVKSCAAVADALLD